MTELPCVSVTCRTPCSSKLATSLPDIWWIRIITRTPWRQPKWPEQLYKLLSMATMQTSVCSSSRRTVDTIHQFQLWITKFGPEKFNKNITLQDLLWKCGNQAAPHHSHHMPCENITANHLFQWEFASNVLLAKTELAQIGQKSQDLL